MKIISFLPLIPTAYRNLSFELDVKFYTEDGAKVSSGSLLAVLKCKDPVLELGVHSDSDGYFRQGFVLDHKLNYNPEDFAQLRVEALKEGISFSDYLDRYHEVGSIYDTFEEWCDVAYSFAYNIGMDDITQNQRVDMLQKYVFSVNRDNSIDLRLDGTVASLIFRYPKSWKIKKGDKVYFSNGDKTYIEFTVLQIPYSIDISTKAVKFNLLGDDIRRLCDNEFEELVIVNNDSGQRQRIKNVWSGFPLDCLGRRTTTTPLEPSVNTFKRYVSTFTRALQDAGFSFEKEMQDVEAPDVKLDPCFVYLMCDSKNGYHKIGISKTPEYRERTLQSEKPTIEMVCAKEYPSRKIAEAIEAALHKVYERERIRGEWFNLSKTDVMMIQKTLK